MLPYLLHASLLLSGCFVFYWLLIRKETFFKLNRWVLISSILLSVTIPLIPVPESMSLRPDTSLTSSIAEAAAIEATASALESRRAESEVVDEVSANKKETPMEEMATPSPAALPEKETTETDTAIKEVSEKDKGIVPLTTINDQQTSASNKTWYGELEWGSLLWYGYLMGVLVFALAFVVQLFVVIARMISLESMRDGRFKIIELVKDEAPYSFWNSIFINPTKYDPDTYQQIIDHEKIHIQQAHFIDKLIAELLVIVFWFNPFVWMFRSAITNNLEYLTDSSMLEIGTEKQAYQMSLLKVSVPQYPLHLTTNYNSSFLKSRIAMMNAKKSSARSSWKYLFLLPLILFSMLCLNEVQSKKADLLAEIDQTEVLQEQASYDDQEDTNTLLSKDKQKNKDKQKSKDKQKDKDKNKSKDKAKQKNKVKNKVKSNKRNFILSGNQFTDHWNDDLVNANIRPGEWEGEIDGNNVCLQLNTSRPSLGYRSYNTACFKKSEFSEIPMNQDKEFNISREAGKLVLNGSFTGSFGDGTFEYVPDESFHAYLKGENLDIRKDKQIHLFLADVNKSYIDYLRKEGLNMDGDDLTELAIHGVDRQKAQGYIQLFNDLDYKGYKVRDLIQFEIHDVTPEYVNEIRALGMTDLTVRDVVQARIHDVEPSFIKSVKDYGFADIDLDEIIQFSIHDVDVEYIEALKNLGYRDLSHRDIVQASIHDVDPDYIKEMSEAGFKDMDMNQLIQFAIHDIDADYVRDFKAAGLDVSERDIVQAGIHDVDIDYVKGLKAYGMNDLDMNQIVQFAIHDVDIDYLKEMKALGYDDLSHRDIVQASIHDVDTRFIKSLKENGLGDLSMNDIIQLAIHDVDARYLNEMRAVGYKDLDHRDIVQARIHDVDPDYIKELKAQGLEDLDIREVVQFAIHDIEVDDIKAFRAAGFDIDNQDIIQAGIHDVSARYIKEMRAMGFEDEDLDEFIKAKIHGVNPSFIKRARDRGHNPKSLREYVKLKIGGI